MINISCYLSADLLSYNDIYVQWSYMIRYIHVLDCMKYSLIYYVILLKHYSHIDTYLVYIII